MKLRGIYLGRKESGFVNLSVFRFTDVERNGIWEHAHLDDVAVPPDSFVEVEIRIIKKAKGEKK